MDYFVYDQAEGWQLDLGDQVVYVDYDDFVHHVEVYDKDDQDTDIVGSGFCHDCQGTCYFTFGAFEEVELWTLM